MMSAPRGTPGAMPTTALTPGKLVPFEVGPTSHGWHKMEAFAAGCPQEHLYRHVRNIRYRPMGADAPMFMHFAVGILVHVARAQWLNDGYKGQLWLTAMKKFHAEHKKMTGEELPDGAYGIALRTFQAYVAYWTQAMKSKVLAVEYEVKPKKFDAKAPDFVKRGARFDSIERWQGKTWIGELKTSYGGASGVQDMYALHGQPLLAMALWGKEETEKFGDLAGVLLYPVKKATLKDPGKIYPPIPLKKEKYAFALDWFKRDFATWVMQTQLMDWNSRPERRPNCVRPFGPCEYREICLHGRDGTLGYVMEDGSPMHAWKPSPGKEVPPWR